MSQNTNAQHQTAKSQSSPSGRDQRGTPFLDVAGAIYLIVLFALVGSAALGFHADASKRAAIVLLAVPAVLCAVAFGIFYSVFLVSSLANIPLIRFSNVLSAAQRNWKGIVSTALLLGTMCAILTLTA